MNIGYNIADYRWTFNDFSVFPGRNCWRFPLCLNELNYTTCILKSRRCQLRETDSPKTEDGSSLDRLSGNWRRFLSVCLNKLDYCKQVCSLFAVWYRLYILLQYIVMFIPIQNKKSKRRVKTVSKNISFVKFTVCKSWRKALRLLCIKVS